MARYTTHAIAPAPDRGDIVLGWLVKVVLALALLGVILFDGLAVVTTRLSVEDQAIEAARTGSESWQRTHSVEVALANATSTALAGNAQNRLPADHFLVDPDGTVHLTLTRSAGMVVSSHIGPLRHFNTVTVAVSGRSNTP